MTAFNVGDVVVARITTQQMRQGQNYKVVDLEKRVLAFGTFVSYQLHDAQLAFCEGNGRFWVNNLHLLADRVEGGVV